MTLESFLEHVNQRKPLNTPEIFQFLNEMNDEARRITAELNNAYHNMDEIRELFSRLSGKPVDPSFRIFPTSMWVKMYLSTLVVISRIREELPWATIA